jgi:hypothetical protein
MSGSPKPASDDLLAKAGGNATAGGVTFQAEVGASFAVYLLAERRLSERCGLGNAYIRSLRFETEAPVDDILIETDLGGWIFVQAKSTLSLSGSSDSELGSVADQIVRQWHACAQGSGQRGWDRPLEPSCDRILIALGRNTPATIAEHLASALASLQANSAAPLSMQQQTALDTFTARLHEAWHALIDVPPDSPTMRSLLSYVSICKFDFNGADRQLAVELLRPLLRDENSAEAGFAVIAQQCQKLMSSRRGTDASGLRRELVQAGLALKAPPSFQNDVEILQNYSDNTEAQLSHYEETKVGADKVRVDRQCAQAVILAAIKDSLLIIGEPGSGKSAVLNTAAKCLREQKLDVVILAVDRLLVNSSEGLQSELGISHPIREVLRNWPGEEPAFVFIDALDATRGGTSDAVFRNLIADVLDIGGRWRVVASIRTFDLRLGEQFRRLFQGPPPDWRFIDQAFPDVRHIEIPPWTPDELDQLLKLAPKIATAIQKGGQRLRHLALVPFNTRLLADLISGGLSPEDFGEISSQVGLLQLYWRRRVEQHGTAAELCLRRTVSEMVDTCMLRANKLNAAGTEPAVFDTLLHENVLVLLPGDRHIAFRHHILFDYAASRVYLDPDDIFKTAALLAGKSQLGLMLAPALAFALQGLWVASENDRTSFWSAIVTIAGAIESDPIARSVAARVACEFPATAVDMYGLSAALRRLGDQKTKAISALGHIVGALAIRLEDKATVVSDPWCYLAAEVNDIVADVVWPLRTLLYLLTGREQTPECRNQLGTAARALLRFAVDHPNFASYLTIAAIGFVADTYSSDPAASRSLLQEILKPERVRDHGHEDLPWLARKIKTVWEADPDFAVEIYGVTFGSEITDTSKTSIGQSRILPLTSTRKQDFDMANYSLKEAFPQFLNAHPSHAVTALIRAIDGHIALKHPSGTATVSTVMIDGREATLAEDGSRFWAWNPNEEHGDNTAGLLGAMVSRLRTLPAPEAYDLIDLIIRRNRFAIIWSRLFMVAAEKPAELGRLLWPYAIQRPFLTSPDTRKDAVDLIAARYSYEGVAAREAFERAALDLDFSIADDPIAFRQAFCLRLFRTIGRDHLVTPEARSFLDIDTPAAGQGATNPRPFSLHVSSSSPESWWWLKNEGVDVDSPANARLLAHTESIKAAFGILGASAAPITDIAAAIEALQELVDAASDALRAGAPQLVTDYAAGMAAAGAKHLAAFEPERFDQQPEVLSSLTALILELTHHPAPEPDPEQEARLEDNPAWGFPAARVDAAEAAILLCRINSPTVALLQPRLEALLRDPHAAVRFVVAQHLTALWETDRALMWSLARKVTVSEPNRGVLRFFANSCLGRLLHADPEQVEALVTVLLSRAGSPTEKATAALLEEVGSLIALLWVSYARPEARRILREWLTAIPDHQSELSHAIAVVRGALILGYGNDIPTEKLIRQRSQEFATWTVEASATELETYFGSAADSPSASNETELASSCARTLSQICDQLYFASGAFRVGQSHTDQGLDTIKARKAFLDDIAPMLHRIGDVAHPAAIHHLIELLDFLAPADPGLVFDLVAHALLGAGKKQGYQFESLGADRFVQVIGRFLADNRDIFLSDERRLDLIACLDVFSEVGWPAARRLLYRLPELLR